MPVAGDLATDRVPFVNAHAAECPHCRQRLAALAKVDASLRRLPRIVPPEQTVLNVRRVLSRGIRSPEPEVMTLQEVADFLRIPLEDLYETVDEMPAFELAGRILVRRAKLVEWLETRERAYRRQLTQREAARSLAGDSQRRLP